MWVTPSSSIPSRDPSTPRTAPISIPSALVNVRDGVEVPEQLVGPVDQEDVHSAILARGLRRQKSTFSMTRAVRGIDGWKWMSSTPSAGSPGRRDV